MFTSSSHPAAGVSHTLGPADGAGSILCFSDIDGTLVHYDLDRSGIFSGGPDTGNLTIWKEKAKEGRNGALHRVIRLPPSHSGAQGTISLETLHLTAGLRAKGTRLVLITGGRLTTLLQRLPFLPAADAYVCENGGRIFYPDSSLPTACPLAEDMQWRTQHNATAGPPAQEWLPPDAREGALWEAYRMLKQQGWQPDTASYTTCFRLKLPKGRGEEELAQVIRQLPAGLSTSFNLGCLDVYPFTSGKSRAGVYLLTHYQIQPENSILLCDDDNDLKLAAVVSRVFLPGVTSESVRQAVEAEPAKFVTTLKEGVLATEEMLKEVTKLVRAKLA